MFLILLSSSRSISLGGIMTMHTSKSKKKASEKKIPHRWAEMKTRKECFVRAKMGRRKCREHSAIRKLRTHWIEIKVNKKSKLLVPFLTVAVAQKTSTNTHSNVIAIKKAPDPDSCATFLKLFQRLQKFSREQRRFYQKDELQPHMCARLARSNGTRRFFSYLYISSICFTSIAYILAHFYARTEYRLIQFSSPSLYWWLVDAVWLMMSAHIRDRNKIIIAFGVINKWNCLASAVNAQR